MIFLRDSCQRHRGGLSSAVVGQVVGNNNNPALVLLRSIYEDRPRVVSKHASLDLFGVINWTTSSIEVCDDSVIVFGMTDEAGNVELEVDGDCVSSSKSTILTRRLRRRCG